MLFGMLLDTPVEANWITRSWKTTKRKFKPSAGTKCANLSEFFTQINSTGIADGARLDNYGERYEDASHELIADSYHQKKSFVRTIASVCTFSKCGDLTQNTVDTYNGCEGAKHYIEFMNNNPPKMAWDFDAKTGFDLGKSFWEMNQFTTTEEGWLDYLRFDFLKQGARDFKEYFSVDLANLSCASVVGAFAILLWIIPGMWYTASIGGVGFMAAQYSYFRLTDTYTRYKNDESQLISNHEWIETVVGGACIAWPVVIWCAMQFSSLAPGSMTNIFSCFF